MASKKSQQKSASSAQKRADAKALRGHQKAVLKVAKARGLTSIDLRKPLSRYAKNLAKKYEAVYQGEASVVTIPKKNRTAIRGKVFDLRNGKAVVLKKDLAEVATFDKKTGQIKVRNSRTGKTRYVGRKQRVTILMSDGRKGKKRRSFSGGDGGRAAAAAFLAAYEDDDGELGIDYDQFDEFYDTDSGKWVRD
jgi:hypothetical protein